MDFWTLAALLLIVSPVNLIPDTAQYGTLGMWEDPQAMEGIKRAAYMLDIAEEGNEQWPLRYFGELRWCRQSWIVLRNTPPSSDRFLFPDYESAKQTYQFIEQFSLEMDRRWWDFPEDRPRLRDLSEAMGERRRVWGAIYEMHRGSVSDRRTRLAYLRDTLGPSAYYSGQLPSPVPVKFLREIDR